MIYSSTLSRDLPILFSWKCSLFYAFLPGRVLIRNKEKNTKKERQRSVKIQENDDDISEEVKRAAEKEK